MTTTTTPGYVSNAQLAQQLSDLVDRWNTRENQMLALLSQPTGDVTVTDGAGVDHVIPSYLQLNNDVTAQLDSLTGAVAQAQSINSQSLSYSNQAAASASAAATSETNAATSAANAADSATSASASASAASTSETNAAASASAALTSETNAAASAAAAATSKTDADSDATAAANSAAAAASSAAQAAQSAAGKLAWLGVWDISGGTLPPAPPSPGFYWISGSATISGEVYGDGDALVWGTENVWHHIDNQQVVASVAGLTGSITVAQLQTALNLAAVATSGKYSDLSGKPTLAVVATSGNYADLTNKPALFSGSYSDLTNKPTLGTAAAQDTTAFATAAQGAEADNSVQLSNSYLAGADANTALTSGFYALASPSTNTPDANWTTVFTASGINGRAFQIAESWNSGKIYWRPYNTGTFGSWNEIWHTGNLTPNVVTGGGFGAAATRYLNSGAGNTQAIYVGERYYGAGLCQFAASTDPNDSSKDFFTVYQNGAAACSSITLSGGKKLSKITVSSAAPGTLADGELYLQY